MNQLSFEEFKIVLKHEIEVKLGYEVFFVTIRKQNRSENKMNVKKSGSKIAAAYNIDNLYTRYLEDGEDTFLQEFLGEVNEHLADIGQYEKHADEAIKYETAKGWLQLVVCDERHIDFLNDTPHEHIEGGLAGYVALVDRNTKITVNNGLLETWKISKEQLFKDALENTMKRRPMELTSLFEFLTRQLPEAFDLNETPSDEFMWIASNREKNYGASVIMFPDFLDKIKTIFGDDFVIIPSSVHELIILKNNKCIKEQLEMHRNIQRTEVEPDDRLLEDGIIIHNVNGYTKVSEGEKS